MSVSKMLSKISAAKKFPITFYNLFSNNQTRLLLLTSRKWQVIVQVSKVSL